MADELPTRTDAPPLLELIAANLPSIFPGAVVVDHGLEFGGSGAVDLAAVDGEGRLLLVFQVEVAGPEPVLFTLDVLAFARKNLPLLSHHFSSAGLAPELEPQVVLVAESFDATLLSRLGGLDPALLSCLEIRRLSSSEREQTYLVPVVPSTGAEASRTASRPTDFLQHLSPDLRPVGERLLERLARIDEDMTSTSSGRQMRFALDDEPVCVLQADTEALEARVVPEGGTFRVTTRADVEAFLEEVLQRTLEVFEPRGRASLLSASAPLDPAPDPASLREAAFDPLMPSGAILTPEEIEAFRSMG